MLKRRLTRGLRRVATLLAATAMAGVGFAGSAHAFSYSSGDLVGVVWENSTELIVNLGTLSSGQTFSLPSQFGGNLAGTGAKFIAFTVPNRLDPNGIVTFTAPSSTNVIGFNTPDGAFSSAIANAMQSLDQANGTTGFLNRLNSIPAADGTNIFANTANILVLNAATFSNSYTQTLNTAGDDKINGSFPFSTALLFNGGVTASGNLWTGQVDPNNIFGADLLTLNGVVSAHDNGNDTVTFALGVPEPGTLLLLGSGLMGLLAIGRRRKEA